MNETKKSFIEKATLEYMINPLYEAYSNNNIKTCDDGCCLSNEEKKFYKKRIICASREMFKENTYPKYLQALHSEYTKYIVEYLKLIDRKDILQEEYNNLPSKSKNKINMNTSVGEANEELYNIKVQESTLDTFITKKNTNKKVINPPRRKNINLKNPILKTKGVKKK